MTSHVDDLCRPSLVLSAMPVLAQDYPNRPIRVVIAFAPGGSTDIIARLFANKLKDRLGQPVIVDPKPGGGSRIGTEYVAKQPPDGYTLFHATVASFVTASVLTSQPTYDPIRDFTPVIQLSSSLLVVAVTSNFAASDMRQIVSYFKDNPSNRAYASQGIGSSSHLAAQLFWSMSGLEMRHVPYKGGSSAHMDVVGGGFRSFSMLTRRLQA